MDETTDLLKIKIEKTKRELPLETVNAIDAVDWKTTILGLRSKYGYTFEQLGDLELETELLLAGLVSAEEYPKELENRMRISKSAVNDLVKEMNNLVFQKIQEELIKNIERKKVFQVSVKSENPPQLSATPQEGNKTDTEVLNSAGIKIIPGQLELSSPQVENVPSILAQKLSGSSQIPMVETQHSLENLTKNVNDAPTPAPQTPKAYVRGADPYRLSPNE